MRILDKTGTPFEDLRSHQVHKRTQGDIAWADPLRLFPQQLYQYNPSLLASRKGLEIFDEIRRDDQVKAALSFKKHALISTGWEINSPEGQPEDWEPTEFVREQLEALEGTFKEALLQILTALDFGFSVTEKVMAFDGAMANLVALKTRRPHSFRFNTDEYGNMMPKGVVQVDRWDAWKELPVDKFVLLQYQKEFGNPYGISDLDAAYRAWWGKTNAYKWMMMLLERHGVPPIFALYNSNYYKGSALDDLRSILSALQANTSGTLPRGDEKDLELWTPELAGQVAQVFIPAMKAFNEDIARSVLMPGLMGLTPEQSSGSLARARVIFDVFLLVVEYLRSVIEERVVNEQIIKPLVAMNFAVDEFPFFQFNPITEAATNELLKSWGELVNAGAVVNTKDDEDHIRTLLEFPEREGEEMPPLEPEPEPEPEEEPPTGEEPPEEEPEEELEPMTLDYADPLTGREPTGPPIEREKTKAERAVNFQQIDSQLGKIESKAVDSLVATFKAIERTMVGRLKRQGPSMTVPKVMPGQINAVRGAIDGLLKASQRAGQRSVRQELPRTTRQQDEPEPVAVDPRQLERWLEANGFWITDVMSQTVLDEARQAMLKSIEIGETTQQAIERLREVFLPYVGSGQIQREGKLLTPHRIETIVRTNTTKAFNKGRLEEIMRPQFDDVIDFVQYSAIMDERTTQICRTLDGKIFRRDDPALQNFTPPNHFNCRSILVPVTPDIEVDEKDIVTPKVAGRAEELKGKGFTEEEHKHEEIIEPAGPAVENVNVEVNPPNVDLNINQEQPKQPDINVTVQPPNVTVNVPNQEAPKVDITTPEPVVNVTLESPDVLIENKVDVPDVVIPPANINVQPTPVTVEAPKVNVEAPVVNVEPAEVTIEPQVEVQPNITIDKTKGTKRVEIRRDSDGKISSATIEEK